MRVCRLPGTGAEYLTLSLIHIWFRSRLQIIDIARPVLLEVSRELGQSVHLCAYNKGMVYVIDQVVSDLPYSMSVSYTHLHGVRGRTYPGNPG